MRTRPLDALIAPAGTRAGSDSSHRVYSVTKHDGFVPSDEYFKKQVFSRDLGDYKRVHPGDFAYATIHLDEGSIGVAPADGLISPMYTVFRPDADLVDTRYLLRFMKSPAALSQYPRFGKGSVHRRKAISLEALGQLEVPLPSLDEQSRIAEILDAGEVLRRKQRSVFDSLDALSNAIFVHLFGDPVLNPHGWKRAKLGQIISGIASGESPTCESRPAQGDEWAILKLGSVSYLRFKAEENKAFLGDVSSIRRVEVRPRDLLFSRKNTKDLVGATAVVGEAVPARLLLPDLIFRLDLIPGVVEPEYLHGLLTNSRKRPQVVSMASGSASSMSNISQARLRELTIELPPVEHQRHYACQMRAVDRARGQHEVIEAELTALFTSLQSRAFSGQL